MSQLVLARIVLLLAGVVVWGYGYRYDDANIRLVGIGILAVAMLLRFARRRHTRDDAPPPP